MDAYQSLRQSPGVFVRLSGTEGRVELLTDSTYYASNSTALLNVVSSRDRFVRQRIAANGDTLFLHRPLPNEYFAAPYRLTGENPPDPNQLMLQTYAAASQGLDAWVARLKLEVFGSPSPVWRPWVPNGKQHDVFSPHPGYRDPVDNTLYRPTPDRAYIVFEAGDPVWRTIVFELATDDRTARGSWTLGSIHYAERAGNRLTDVSMAVVPIDSQPESSLFSFVPPSNARPIALTKGG